MSYCAPLLHDLYTFIETLRSLYTKENPERIKIIKFIESFQSLKNINAANAAQIILGACVYGLEKISNDYHFFSPDQNNAIFFSAGSALYNTLKQGLYISDANKLDDQQRLIYLVFLYDHLAKQDKNPYLDDLKDVLKRVLSRLNLEVNLLLNEKPIPSFLHKAFNELPEKYRKDKKNKSFISSISFGYKTPEREHYIRLIEMIKNQITSPITSDSSREYSICYGALLYIMSEIELEYHYRSPENSKLYQECQRILNIKQSSEIHPKLKAKYFADLHSFTLAPLNSDSFEEECKKLSKKLYFIINHDDCANEKSYLEGFAHTISDFGVKIILGEIAVDFLKKICINEKTVISGIGYITGTVTPQTIILCNLITTLLNEKIKANIINTISNTLNAIIIQTATQPIIITYKSISLLNQFANHLLTKAKKNIGNIDNMDWIYALMCLPDDIFPQYKKNIIEHVVELNKAIAIPLDEPKAEYTVKLYQQ